ncbi:WD-repeat protein, putative [Plasmodium gallinaceum]|uniref:WD-repeat protein, putative n=1 Tax=Plasmodium gallinaceum TaxID=5849 RepID=A0A1J1GXC3_PLAGA|nr:WD-repeat protein, putative [Plasmodium gallinaceum]CRG96942.1 WD-repeat protein, putative [Plasmodium gallinaceum]
MEYNKIMLVYDNNEILLVNLDNERCENKYENSIKDKEKKICMLNNGNFIILNANRKVISQYLSTKNAAIYTKFVRVNLSVIKLTKNEKIIFGGDKIGNIYVWSSISGFLINYFQAHFGEVKDILIDQILNVVYTYSDDNIIHVYNLSDVLKKKKVKPMLLYQHNINASIRQIISVTPNIYDTYYTLISLTSNGNLHIFGLKSKKAVYILKTNTENCTYICSNEPFNTHLYLCKGNKIFRIPFTAFSKNNENNIKDLKCKKDIKLKEYGDYVQIVKKKSDDIFSNFKENEISKNENENESYLNLKDFTIFLGHKNDVIKCYVNDKKQIMISLAKDGIRIWDIFNCYTIKSLKYGENVIDFFVPNIKIHSYLIEFPNLTLEYEDDAKINFINEIKQNDCYINYKLFLGEENTLINMANMFATHGL